MKTTLKLRRLASISAGYPIRGRVEHMDGGELLLVQLKNVNPVYGIHVDSAARIHHTGRKTPDYLQPNDILFVNRGLRFFGVLVDRPLEHAVAAPHFFVVRVMSETVVPGYLAWFLNHKRAQRYFGQCAAGSALPHVSSKTLGDLPVTVPDMDTQRRIVAAHGCLLSERKTMEELLNKRRQLVSEILDRALDGPRIKGVKGE